MTSLRSDDGTLSTVVAKTFVERWYVGGTVFGSTSSSLSGPSVSIRALTFVLLDASYWIDSGVTASWPDERPRTSSRSQAASRGSGESVSGSGAGGSTFCCSHALTRGGCAPT